MTETTTEPRTVTLTIPGTPAYSLSPNSRQHWAVKQRETTTAHWQVRGAMHDYAGPFFAVPVRIAWTIYLDYGGKRRDMDNALASLKAHQDALVSEGVLPGDSPRWIPETPKVDQIVWSKHRSDPRIVVVITEVVGS